MARNIELKARVRDWDRQRALAATLSDRPAEQLDQEDTFFQVPHGRLKLRVEAPDAGELIYYERADAPHVRVSDYARVPTTAPAALAHALGKALGVRGVVRKRRTLYRVGRTRLHFDEVDGLGQFMEIEVVLRADEGSAAAEAEARALCAALGIDAADIIAGAYVDLLARRTA